MYVVTVEFDIAPRFADAFMKEMLQNAESSRTLEPGCRQFDVCMVENDPTRIFLYEVYDDRAAFEAHRATVHFKHFDATVKPWTVDKRVKTYQRVS